MDNFDKVYSKVDSMLAEGAFKSAVAGTLLGLGALGADAEAASPRPNNSNDITMNTTRGARNNNPGNIEAGGSNWEGAVGDDGRFLQFAEMRWGIRAMSRILQTYKNKYGIDTVRGVITKWAPPHENDTEKYIRNVEEWSKIPSDTKIDLADHSTLRRLIAAIIRQETSAKVSYRDVQDGLDIMWTNYKK